MTPSACSRRTVISIGRCWSTPPVLRTRTVRGLMKLAPVEGSVLPVGPTAGAGSTHLAEKYLCPLTAESISASCEGLLLRLS